MDDDRQSPEGLRISGGFRLALAGKGLLLACLALAFVGVAIAAGSSGWPWVARIVVGVASLGTAGFLFWAAALALLDAAFGRAEQVPGARALASRRAGHSLRAPDGRFAEFILWNPWSSLEPGGRYTVVVGRFSRVVVAPPIAEPS